MYENVNKLHPYIEKELEGIEVYDLCGFIVRWRIPS